MLHVSASDSRAPVDPLVGRTLGNRYRITSLLGRGGMSRVYQAVQAPLQRAVALKVLKDDPADPMLQQRFLLEARRRRSSPKDRFANMDELLAAFPGDRPAGKRPPPLPLDFEIDDPGSVRLTGFSQTSELDQHGDTHELSASEGDVRELAGKPMVVQTSIEEQARARGRRKGIIAALLLAVAAAGAGVALYGRAEAKPKPVAVAAAAAAPPVAAKQPAAPVPATRVPEPAPAPVVSAAQSVATDASRAVVSPPAEPAAAEIAPPPEPAKSSRKRAKRASPPARHAKAQPASPEVVEAFRERLGRALSGIRQCAMLDSNASARSMTVHPGRPMAVHPAELHAPDLSRKA